jgi:AmmeMemoRadiSam system protein A
MERSASPELTPHELDLLVDIADASLVAALAGREYGLPPLEPLPEALRAHVGAFVTLTVDGILNGCIGDVQGRDPLAWSVARLALAAAFEDPRLPALRPSEYDRVDIEVSVLSPMAPIPSGSRREVLDALEPEVHGLVIRALGRSALFLPSVWEQLPDPDEFLDQLFRKAGLRPGTWPSDMQAFRFTTQHRTRHAGIRTASRRD